MGGAISQEFFSVQQCGTFAMRTCLQPMIHKHDNRLYMTISVNYYGNSLKDKDTFDS